MALGKPRPHAATRARKRWDGISARYAYPIADAPVVLNVATQAKKTRLVRKQLKNQLCVQGDSRVKIPALDWNSQSIR
jgi:hypothetical protein